jgi:hypothetical protein
MKKSRFSEEEIIRVLREGGREPNKGGLRRAQYQSADLPRLEGNTEGWKSVKPRG